MGTEPVTLPPDVIARIQIVREQTRLLQLEDRRRRTPRFRVIGEQWHSIKLLELTPREYREAGEQMDHSLGFLNACQAIYLTPGADIEKAEAYIRDQRIEVRNTSDPYRLHEIIAAWRDRLTPRNQFRSNSGIATSFVPPEVRGDTVLFGKFGVAVNADCHVYLPKIAAETVNLILTDPPYGSRDDVWLGRTHNEWDRPLSDWNLVWAECWRVLHQRGLILFCCEDPLSCDLQSACRREYKWTYHSLKRPANFMHVKREPMLILEDIKVFTRAGTKYTYNPQRIPLEKVVERLNPVRQRDFIGFFKQFNGDSRRKYATAEPTNLIVPAWSRLDKFVGRKNFQHCQKSVDLMRHLIRTHSDPGDVVLDFCAGSMTVAIACILEHRQFIVVEQHKENFERGVARIRDFLNSQVAEKGEANPKRRLQPPRRSIEQFLVERDAALLLRPLRLAHFLREALAARRLPFGSNSLREQRSPVAERAWGATAPL